MRNKCVRKPAVKPKTISKYTLVGKKCPKGFIRHKTMKNKCVRSSNFVIIIINSNLNVKIDIK